MKRTLAIVGTPAVAALVVLGGAPAHAAEKHHDHAAKAEQRQHDRKVERRQERRAERAATKTAQDTTTTPTLGHRPTGGTSASDRSRPGLDRGVVSCAVTAERAGTAFTITNGCDSQQTLIITTQAQPGPWHVGLCAETKACHLLHTLQLTVQPGTRTWPVQTTGACFVQVDVKWDGRLLRSNHYVNDCSKPTPPIAHPKPKPPVVGHQPHARVRLTSTPTSSSMVSLPRTGGMYDLGAYAGFGLLVAGGLLIHLTRYPRRTTKAWKQAQR